MGILPRRVWLVGVDAKMASTLSSVLAPHGYVTEQISEKAIAFDCEPKPTAVVLSVMDRSVPALNVLVRVQNAVPPIPAVVLVAPHQASAALEALRLGAADALVFPFDPADLLAVLRAVEHEDRMKVRRSKPDFPQQSAADTAVFVSRNPKMLNIWDLANAVARTDVPVLILGESGVGKEVLARFLHRHSPRAGKPMVKVNCAALPHALLESELFGYERGAFTGAVNDKPGKFEIADKGCILLDEIGEMAPNLQAKLLHVLEDGEFSKLGGKRPVRVDVRVLALTNRKLDEAIPRGEFRDDLYFRLNVVKISIPPLRERKEDIPLLAAYFLKRHRDALESEVEELPAELIEAFMQYHWPGNVRELENTVRRYLIQPEVDMELSGISPARVSPPDPPGRAMATVAARQRAGVQLPGPNDSVSLKQVASVAAESTERELVLHVLQQTNWNRRHAARRLNICYRALLNKLKKWQINRPRAS